MEKMNLAKSLYNGDPDVIQTRGLLPHYSGIGTCKHCWGSGFDQIDFSIRIGIQGLQIRIRITIHFSQVS
jgi:hypothetical protein